MRHLAGRRNWFLRCAFSKRCRAAFRPEFLNRLDEILVLRRLSREDMVGIFDIQLKQAA